jgi:hypothetical protein
MAGSCESKVEDLDVWTGVGEFASAWERLFVFAIVVRLGCDGVAGVVHGLYIRIGEDERTLWKEPKRSRCYRRELGGKC